MISKFKKVAKPTWVAYLAACCILVVAAGCGQAAAPAAPPTKAPAATQSAPAAAPTKAPAATQAAAASALPALPKVPGYPSRPIEVIVPVAAGGPADSGTRILMAAVEKEIGGQIEIVNKEGAGQQVGLQDLALAKPDGYTIGLTVLPTAITDYLDPTRKAQFSFKSFQPVALQVVDPIAVAVKADSKYKTVKDLVDDAKARPGAVKAGATGVLSSNHLAILELENMTGSKFAVVQFNGGAPSMDSLLGGHTDVAFGTVGDFIAQVKAGAVRILGVMDSQRSKFYPDVPTFAEEGYNIVMVNARGYSVPSKTDPQIVKLLEVAIQRSMASPDVVQKSEGLGLDQRFMDSAAFTKYWQDQETAVAPLVKAVRQ